MATRVVFLFILIAALAMCATVTSGYAWSRFDCDQRAHDYAWLSWTAGADGYWDHDTSNDPSDDIKVFEEGNTYTGMAYWYGGWDTIDQFLNKMAAGKAPRQEAGIDCSGLVSRCWDVNRNGGKYNTKTIKGISTQIEKSQLELTKYTPQLCTRAIFS